VIKYNHFFDYLSLLLLRWRLPLLLDFCPLSARFSSTLSSSSLEEEEELELDEDEDHELLELELESEALFSPRLLRRAAFSRLLKKCFLYLALSFHITKESRLLRSTARW